MSVTQRAGVFALVVAFAAGACGDATTSDVSGSRVLSAPPAKAKCNSGRVEVITVTPASLSVGAGGSAQLVATALDRQGREVSNADVCWESADPTTVTVSPTGLVTGVKAGGPVQIRASTDHVPATAASTGSVTVTGAIASIQIEPLVSNLVLREAIQLSVVARDANGNVVPSGNVTWQSSDATRATISPTGLLTGVKSSMSHSITATAGGVSKSIQFPVIPLVVLQLVLNLNLGITSTNPIVGLGIDGAIVETITDCTAGDVCGDEHPSFSPSGLSFVFRRLAPKVLMTADVSGQNLQQIVALPGPANMSSVSWGANGLIALTKLVTYAPPGINPCEDQDIFTITLTGSDFRNVTNSACTPLPDHTYQIEQSPVWSPANRLYFSRTTITDGANIYSSNADGSGATQITTGINNGFEADVSPDGTKLVVRRTGSTLPNLWVMNADGSAQEQITFGLENPGTPHWAGPRTVVFCSQADGGQEYKFFKVDVITKAVSKLWDTPCYSFSWNPLRK